VSAEIHSFIVTCTLLFRLAIAKWKA